MGHDLSPAENDLSPVGRNEGYVIIILYLLYTEGVDL